MRGEVIEGKEPGEKYTTGDYTVDEKHRTVALTEEGVLKVEKLLDYRQPVRPGQHRDEPPRAAGAARPRALSSATATTWSRTARSSSSTSSPAA